VIHEAESCTIVYYRREEDARPRGRMGDTAAAIPKILLSLRPTHPGAPLVVASSDPPPRARLTLAGQ